HADPEPGLPAQRAGQRQAVNNWILTSHTAGISDGVINFASALAYPLNSTYINPPDNSGDSLHPSDLGYETMAGAVPLSWVNSSPACQPSHRFRASEAVALGPPSGHGRQASRC
ncbi:MAG TPA: hypothetical protein VH478_14360, partial [Trebonia sp.]|nr:hypothetical protein [Trebonia sp.]